MKLALRFVLSMAPVVLAGAEMAPAATVAAAAVAGAPVAPASVAPAAAAQAITPATRTVPAPTKVPPLAHSALLTIDATEADDSVALHIAHAANGIPIDGKDVTVAVDGKDEPVTPQVGGTFLLSLKDVRGDGEKQLDIIVAHDGIREILSGKLPPPKVSATANLWRDHKQVAWWILNVTIILIAAVAFSRRSAASS